MRPSSRESFFFQQAISRLVQAVIEEKSFEPFLGWIVSSKDVVYAAIDSFQLFNPNIDIPGDWDIFSLPPGDIINKIKKLKLNAELFIPGKLEKPGPHLTLIIRKGSWLGQKKHDEQWSLLQTTVKYFTKSAYVAEIESEKRYKAVVEAASDLIAIYVDDVIRYVNPSAVRMLGMSSADEIIGQSLYKFVHPDSMPVIEQRREIFRRGAYGPLPPVGEKLITPSGEIKEIEVVTNVIEYFGKLAVLAVGRDVTKRKRVEEALLESEHRYRALVERSPNAIIVINQQNNIIYLNPGGVHLLGCQNSQPIIDRHISDFLYELDKKDLLGKARGQMVETVLKPMDGPVIDVELLAAEISRMGESAMQLIVRDISARKKAERSLIDSKEEMRRLFRYAQNVAEIERTHISREIHDQLGQFLTGLKMDAAYIKRHLSQDQAALQKKITNMSALIDSTIHMVRRISSKLRPEILDNFGLVAALEWQSKDYEERSGIQCIFTANPPGLNLNKEMNTVFFRIYQELMTNVIRHAHAKNIYIRLEQNAQMNKLSLEDDGIGIDLDKINRHDSLGIIGMRERAQYLNGDIIFKRKEDGGTMVIVSIPRIDLEKNDDKSTHSG